jgi:hypothetical protein
MPIHVLDPGAGVVLVQLNDGRAGGTIHAQLEVENTWARASDVDKPARIISIQRKYAAEKNDIETDRQKC